MTTGHYRSTPVDLSPVSDFQNQYDEDLILDLVDDPVLSHPDPVRALIPFHLLHSGGSRVLLELLEATDNPILDGTIQFP